MNRFILTILVLLILVTFKPALGENNPELTFNISGKKETVIDLYELKNKLDSKTITLKDPYYKKQKKYRAFVLKDVLDLAYGNKWKSDKFSDISFRAKDGYEAVSDLSKLSEDGCYLVFDDLENNGWEKIGEKNQIPGPYYIVWKGAHQTAKYGYPWPWQLFSINLMLFSNQYPEVYPKGVSKDSSVYKGFELVKKRCVRCHSINKQGGKVGPDLNAPMNILEYIPVNMVKEFIRHPSKYRYTYMPDNEDLSVEQLNNIIDYLWFKYREKKK